MPGKRLRTFWSNMNMKGKYFELDFFKLLDKVVNKEPFAFTRFSDGEMFMLQGQSLALQKDHVQIDGARFNNQYTFEDFKDFDPKVHAGEYALLKEAFEYSDDNYIKGICCKCCQGKDNFDWMISGEGEFTWSNLFVNSNYRLFLHYMLPALKDRRVFLVCHHSATLQHLPLKVDYDFRVGDNAFHKDTGVIDEIQEYITTEKIDNAVFLFACSTLANLAIYELWRENVRGNTFIDVGSTLNPFIGLSITRGYLRGAFHPQLTSHPLNHNMLNENQKKSFDIGQHHMTDINKVCIW